MSPMAERILEMVTRRRTVSFAELGGIEGFAGGDLELYLPGYPNVVLWSGLTASACAALEELRLARAIHPVPTSLLVYLCDGRMLKLPVARTRGAKRGYRKPHWMPVVFNPGPDPDSA